MKTNKHTSRKMMPGTDRRMSLSNNKTIPFVVSIKKKRQHQHSSSMRMIMTTTTHHHHLLFVPFVSLLFFNTVEKYGVVVAQSNSSSTKNTTGTNIFNSPNSNSANGTQPTVPAIAPSSTTVSPTNTILPTSSTFPPTYIEPCYICGTNENQVVDPTQTVTIIVDNVPTNLTCGDLHIGGTFRFVSPEICPLLQNAGCNCTEPYVMKTDVPTISPAPSSVETYVPTMTSIPTITSWPTGSFKCNLCGTNEKNIIGRMNTDTIETISIDGLLYTCEELYKDSVGRFIPPERCTEIQNRLIAVSNALGLGESVNSRTSSSDTADDTTTSISPLESGCTCIYDENGSVNDGSPTSNGGGGNGTENNNDRDGSSSAVSTLFLSSPTPAFAAYVFMMMVALPYVGQYY